MKIKTAFDARSRLGTKAIIDARDKIITKKKSGGGDARNKIVKNQVDKGTFDARSLLQRQHQKSGRKQKNGGFVSVLQFVVDKHEQMYQFCADWIMLK